MGKNLIRFIPEYIPNKFVQALSEVTDWSSVFTGINKYRNFLQTKGNGINVVILDTGASKTHPDLIDNFKECEDFTGDNDVVDRQGHGCIQPDAIVYSSLYGLQKIEDIFKKSAGILVNIKDGSIVKLTHEYNVSTLSFNPDSQRIENKRIEAVHKIQYQGKVYNVKTRNTNLLLTPWHPLYVIEINNEDFSIVKKRADKLSINDNIVSSNFSKNKIHEKNIFEKIISISIEDYNGYLYDFTIADNHNYVANNIIVSNTHVAGIVGAAENNLGVIGVAPQCNLYSGKVLNNQGLCPPDYSWIIKGLEWAIDIKADVVNMSLGAPIKPPDKLLKIIQEATNKGIILVAASGNEQLHSIDFPGKYNEVISVAAMDKSGNLACYSNIGEELDFIAPGSDIYSTYLNNGYSNISGTCLPDTTCIFTPNRIKYLKDIQEGDEIISCDITRLETKKNKVSRKWSNGFKQIYKIKNNNWSLEATGNHPVLTINKKSYNKYDIIWKRVDELKLNDYVVCFNDTLIYNSKFLQKNVINSQFVMEKILDIEILNKREVFDIEMENKNYPCFIANGFVVHNSMAAPFISGVSTLLLSYHRDGKEHQTPIYNYQDVIDHIKQFEKGKLIDFGNGKGIGILDFNTFNIKHHNCNYSYNYDYNYYNLKKFICRCINNFIKKIFPGKPKC